MSARPSHGAAPTALAPHHLRLFALIVDYLLVVVLLNLGNKLLLGEGWDLRPPDGGTLRAGWLAAGAALLLLRDAAGGRSPGKWLAGIAVARAADPATAPPLRAIVLRNVTLVVLPLEALLVFLDPYGRRLGDRLAGTVVVAQRRPAPALRRLLGLAILFFATTLAIFLLEFWNVRRSAGYPLALQLAAQDARVREAFGEPIAFSEPGLERTHDGVQMQVRLAAQGSRGAGHLTVVLRRAGDPPRWALERLELDGPPATTPPLQDAPRR